MSKQEMTVRLRSGHFRKVFVPDRRWTAEQIPFGSYIAETRGYQYTATVMSPKGKPLGWVFTDEIAAGTTVVQLLSKPKSGFYSERWF